MVISPDDMRHLREKFRIARCSDEQCQNITWKKGYVIVLA
jgi:hypothetical protein